MKEKKKNTKTKASSTNAETVPNDPLWTAGIWNRRQIRGGTFLSTAEIFNQITEADTLPTADYLHGANYPKLFEGQTEPEPLPADVPPAVLKVGKIRNTGKAPTAQIYLPVEYVGRPLLVLALTPEQYALISHAESTRHAQEILNAYPGDPWATAKLEINNYMLAVKRKDAEQKKTKGGK